jgi:alkylation response protein AidB-like acyl-CoA dehydrogenase
MVDVGPTRSTAAESQVLYDQALAWLRESWSPERTLRGWWALLAESGWGYPTWPREWFGRGLSSAEADQVRHAFRDCGVIGPPVRAGQRLAAPTIIAHGTEGQKASFLPRLARGLEQWTQLFSEPGAGSDLASVATRARPTGDEWVVSGQKVWNSFAHVADRGMLLARTAPSQPLHRGLTFFIIDLDQPGVQIRPLRQMNGDQEFNAVTLDDVRIGAGRVVGSVGDGWRVAMTTLAFERFMPVAALSAVPGVKAGHLDRLCGDLLSAAIRSEGERTRFGSIAELAAAAAAARLDEPDPMLRHALAGLTALERTFARTSANSRAGGSAAPTASGSVTKLLRSAMARADREVGLAALGAAGLLLGAGTPEVRDIQHTAVTSPYASIAGGTDEIQRNIIGERILGLPKEPRGAPPAGAQQQDDSPAGTQRPAP